MITCRYAPPIVALLIRYDQIMILLKMTDAQFCVSNNRPLRPFPKSELLRF